MGAGAAVSWIERDARTSVMDLDARGEEWLEVKRLDGARGTRWHVDSRLCGSHYRVAEGFESPEAAQGGALLLAMRLLPPVRRGPLHAALDRVPGAWWWKLVPADDRDCEHRAVFSRRTETTPEAAEHGGRAAGAGWCLFVFGPGCVRTFGLLPR